MPDNNEIIEKNIEHDKIIVTNDVTKMLSTLSAKYFLAVFLLATMLFTAASPP